MAEKIPLLGLPTFEGGATEAAERHDAILGEARSEDLVDRDTDSAGEADAAGPGS